MVLLFTVCRPGFFKASPHSPSCSKCPPHSYTLDEASTSCLCEEHYFRRESDPPTMACTSKHVLIGLFLILLSCSCTVTRHYDPNVLLQALGFSLS